MFAFEQKKRLKQSV